MMAPDSIESKLPGVRNVDIGLLNALINSSRECILLIDHNTIIVAANAAAQATFGREVAEIEQSRLTELIRDPELHVSIVKALDDGEASEIQLEIIGGETRNYDVYVSATTIGIEPHAIAVFYDITGSKNLSVFVRSFYLISLTSCEHR
jgi:PAS domain S-box-containing protein